MRKIVLGCLLAMMLLACGQIQSPPQNSTAMSNQSIYDFTLTTLDGKEVSLSTYKGKKMLLVNTASECGFTPQYAQLEELFRHHSDKLVILGFLANNFGGQEPGTNAEIQSFCSKNYGVTFPMFSKIDVVGENQHPLYRWLCTKELNGWCTTKPDWNFAKYLINEQGELQKFFPATLDPLSEEILKEL